MADISKFHYVSSPPLGIFFQIQDGFKMAASSKDLQWYESLSVSVWPIWGGLGVFLWAALVNGNTPGNIWCQHRGDISIVGYFVFTHEWESSCKWHETFVLDGKSKHVLVLQRLNVWDSHWHRCCFMLINVCIDVITSSVNETQYVDIHK